MSSSAKASSEIVEILQDLNNIMSSANSEGISQNFLSQILGMSANAVKVKKSKFTFDVKTASYVLDAANQVLNEKSWKFTSKRNFSLGPRLLQSMEKLFLKMEPGHEPMNITYTNIEFHGAVSSCSDFNDGNILEVEAGVKVSLPEKTFSTLNCSAQVYSVAYKTLGLNFPNQFEESSESSQKFEITSDIITNVMVLDKQQAQKANVNMTFKHDGMKCGHIFICAFWNSTLEKWSSDGCTTHIANGVTNCFCTHLTSFAVLMTGSVSSVESVHTAILNHITNTGLTISIVSLVVCISLQVVLLQDASNLTAHFRHVILLNIAICLLLSNIFFLMTSFVSAKDQKELCMVVTFCSHFSFLAFFGWTLVQSLFLCSRLVFVFHHVSRTRFLILAVFVGYTCPFVIALVTLLKFSPTSNYFGDSICWLEACSGASLAFTVPAVIILLGNFFALLVVIRTLLRPFVSDNASEDKETIGKLVKAVVFCVPQFGLTWAVGIPLHVYYNSLVLQYLFVILNPLQGFFILLFGCLLDKKVMELFRKFFWWIPLRANTVFSSSNDNSTIPLPRSDS
uniref:Adhesion G-protein coupled receptor F3 n=1 Tax=Geotrypetes seraphini TaxID=260995 RepID=A0A6P8R7U0_GEOSA|nr:adhesion G-protein coupled receptor F3 [Geotrypetes seraphini]